MLEALRVTGEVKIVDKEAREHYLSRGQWKTCPCCEEVFTTARYMLDEEEPEYGDCDWVAWILRMPITRPQAEYCCAYCRQLYHRYHREKEKEGATVRLLKEDWMEEEPASELVDKLHIRFKESAESELPDLQHIDYPNTFIYKFRKGLWRTCRNPGCPNPVQIYYTERRNWQIQGKSIFTETKYEQLHGDRLIPLLDVDYEPKLVNTNWKFCSDSCRVAIQHARVADQRAHKRKLAEEAKQEKEEADTLSIEELERMVEELERLEEGA